MQYVLCGIQYYSICRCFNFKLSTSMHLILLFFMVRIVTTELNATARDLAMHQGFHRQGKSGNLNMPGKSGKVREF